MLYSSSLACGDWLCFGKEIELLKNNGLNMLHIDIMDGHYVPNLCLTLDLVEQIKKKYDSVIDAHLMVDNPEAYLQRCANTGVDICIFHYEAVNNHADLIQKICALSMKPGIAINPDTPIESITHLLKDVDICLVMAVKPGFSGQKFSEHSYKKIIQLNKLREDNDLHFKISVDGGVTKEIGQQCRVLGADILVMGAFTFFEKGKDRMQSVLDSVTGIEQDL